MDKETFDKKVAAIWQVFDATKTLTKAGISTRVNNEAVQALIRKAAAEIGEALASSLAV